MYQKLNIIIFNEPPVLPAQALEAVKYSDTHSQDFPERSLCTFTNTWKDETQRWKPIRVEHKNEHHTIRIISRSGCGFNNIIRFQQLKDNIKSVRYDR